MKHNILTSITGACLLSALVIAGCTKAIPAPSGYPEDGVVRISTGAPVTKAEGDAGAYSGSSLGLYVNYGIGDAYTKDNIQWTKDAGSGEWTPEQQMLWKNPTATPTLWAYAPYSASQLKPSDAADFGKLIFEIPSDQSAGFDAADLVTWGQENYVLDHNSNDNFSADGKVQINFSHALVKLTFDFTIRTQFEPGTTISKVTLHGTTSKVGCDIFSSSVAATLDATSQDIVFHEVDGTHYEGIFFPGDGQKAGKKMLTIVMSDGTELTYTVGTSGLTFESGKSYTMKMYLGRLAVELEQVTLDPWTDSGTEIDGGTGSETSIPVWDGSSDRSVSAGSGSQNDPFIITTGEQLYKLAKEVNRGWSQSGKYFKLGNSIDLGGHEWTPIGNSTAAFEGHFDGNGYTIYGLSIQKDVNGYAGLFGRVKGSKISGLIISEANISGQSGNTGIICGELYGGGEISNCSAWGGSVAGYKAGGICGTNTSSIIKNCNIRGITIEGDSAGGICGYGTGTIESCTVNDTQVTASSHDGGIVSKVTGETTIKNCNVYNSELNCTIGWDIAFAGGLIAQSDDVKLTVSDCTANINIRLAKSKGNDIRAGGFVGELFQYSNTSSFTNCHFNGKFINDEDEIIDFNEGSYININGEVDEPTILIGAAFGFISSNNALYTLKSCGYNADKTGGLPVACDVTIDSGITAVHLGN